MFSRGPNPSKKLISTRSNTSTGKPKLKQNILPQFIKQVKGSYNFQKL